MYIRSFLKWNVIYLLFLTFGLLLSACLFDKTAATGVGNPGEVKGQFAMVASTDGVAAKRALAKSKAGFLIEDNSGLKIEITEIMVNVRHIEFDLPAGVECNENNNFCTQTSIKIDGPFVFDLLAKTSNPEVPEFYIPEGEYKRLDIRLDDVKEDDGILAKGHILENNTMLVKGKFGYDGTENRNLTILIKFNEDARFESEGTISVGETEPHNFLLQFLAANWFSNIDISSCIENEDPGFDNNGDLLLDDSVCGELENNLKENIKNSGQFD